MLVDFFWSIAASTPMLLAIGLLLVVALVVGHIPFGKYMPVIAPYVVLAQFVAYVALALLALLIGFRIADERAAVQRLKTELAWSQNQLRQQKASAEDAARLRDEAAARADALNAKVNDYEARLATLPAPAACALDAGDIDSLRGIAR